MTDKPSPPASENGKSDRPNNESQPGGSEPEGESQPNGEDSSELAPPPLSEIGKDRSDPGDSPYEGSLGASDVGEKSSG